MRPVGVDERKPRQQALFQFKEIYGLTRAVDELEAQMQQNRRGQALIQRSL